MLKHVFYLVLIAIGVFFVQSCVVYQGYSLPPVTVNDIVQMTKDSVPAAQIIQKMKESNTVYKLSAEQLTQLSKEGVAPDVLNYMENTHLEAVRQNQQLEDSHYWWPGWDGYLYGGPAFGWPNLYWQYNWGAGVHVPLGYEHHENHHRR